MTGAITSNIDVAQVVLYAFWIFFAGLIFYLRREDRREGYPLVSDITGKPENMGVIWVPEPKTFLLASGERVQAPSASRDDRRPPNAAPVARWPGAPLEPIGDPMTAGVGPGSWAERADVADHTLEGEPKIVPLRVAGGFHLESRDPDPRGMPVVGADGAVGGTISDVWVDRSEIIVRYLEVAVGPDKVLLPMNFASVDGRRRRVRVPAIRGDQFAGVPKTRNPDQVTLLEEEKIMAYYGAGTLYALPSRVEPLL